jgi:hypothetical protein
MSVTEMHTNSVSSATRELRTMMQGTLQKEGAVSEA